MSIQESNNIHTLDREQANTLKGMFESRSMEDIKLALSILNNIDFSDYQTSSMVSSLIAEVVYLRFDYWVNKTIPKGNETQRLFFWYDDGRLYVDDFKTTITTFKSIW